MRGGVGCGVSADEYSCAKGAQINFGDLTPYSTYGADDTKLGNTATSPEDNERLQLALDKLCKWAKTWGMEVNVKKCKAMHIGYNNVEHAYFMESQQLEVTEEERDIGVNVMKSLKQSAQCKKAARTARTVLSQISRAFHFRDRHVFLRLYVQYVRLHLEFASSAWSPWLVADKELLEKIQRRAVNMVSGLKAGTYEEKLKELEERRHQADMSHMTQVYKILMEKDMVKSDTWFSLSEQCGKEHTEHSRSAKLADPARQTGSEKKFLFKQSC